MAGYAPCVDALDDDPTSRQWRAAEIAARTVTQTIADLLGRYGYAVVALFFVAEGCGIPAPAVTTMVIASALASRGTMSIWGVGVAGLVGGALGGMAGYLIGAHGGTRLLRKYGRKLHVDEERLARAHRFFEHRGLWAVFLCRFIGFVRILVPMFAGIAHMPFAKFSAANATGAVVAAAGYCTLGYLFGRDLPTLTDHIMEATLIGSGLVVLWLVYLRVRARRETAAG
jgi:membrane protein DedA with SNARE-associated domain